MSLESDIALLQKVPLFADLPAEPLRLIAFSAVRLELAEGQVLFRQGAKALSGFVVLAGRIQLVAGDEGARKTEAMCETGALIGEMALFVDTRRPASATARSASQVLEIERKVILRMLNEYPVAADTIRARLAARLNATVAEMARLQPSFGAGTSTDQSRPAKK